MEALVATFGLLGVCDAALCALTVPAATRWPALHALGNAVVCALALPGVIACLGNPAHCMDTNVFPPTHAAADSSVIVVVIAMHAYHAACFSLTPADRFHHALFIPVMSVVGFLFQWGALLNFVAFFVCGLPGMLDYTAICLCHAGAIEPDARRRTTERLSVWIRAPALLFGATLQYVALAHGTTTVPPAVNAGCAVLLAFNAMYYASSSVRSASRPRVAP
jgi:hypothetical protein